MKFQTLVAADCVTDGLGNGDRCCFSLTAEPRRYIHRRADSRIVQMLRGSDIADNCTACMDSNAEAPNLFQAFEAIDPSRIQHTQRTQAALAHHVRPVEDCHDRSEEHTSE